MTEKISKLKNSLEQIEGEITTLSTSVKDITEKDTELGTKVSNLQTTLKDLTEKGDTLTNDRDEKKKLYDDNEEKISDLKHTKMGLETEISKAELRLKELTTSIAQHETKLDGLKKDLVSAEDIYAQKVKTIEDEKNGVLEQTKNKEIQYKMLKLMLEEEYVKTNYYFVLKAMKQSGVNSLVKLKQASAVGGDEVTAVLKAMSARGVIDFDQASGKYTMKKEFII
ncbi:MAG: hypothetical protein INQ03_02975 [Candidatus Heimdallarchaeota archaeon]|nr:hypothetical protein [Candidatus Heimdallarchaeota archaeon]